jgi:hypothetical protein
VPARNRVRALSQLLTQRLLRHPLANKMNFRTMKSNLVGRGSRTTENYSRSSETFHAPGSVGPTDLPSRGSKMWQAFGRDSNVQTVFPLSSRWVRLGKPVGLNRHEAGINNEPCEYYLAVREPRPTKLGPRPTKLVPRPTKVPVTNHFSLFTSHLSHQGYVCS